MTIYEPALVNLNESKATGPILAALAEAIDEQIQATGAQTAFAEFKLGFISPDTPEDELPKKGEYVPEVIIRLTQA